MTTWEIGKIAHEGGMFYGMDGWGERAVVGGTWD